MQFPLGLLIIAFDQVTKALLPALTINTGLAFGLLSDSRVLTQIVLGLAVVVTIWLGIKADKHRVYQRFGWTLVWAGLLSNLIDRLFLSGAVRDPFSIGELIPAFNAADVSIVCGLGLLLLASLSTS